MQSERGWFGGSVFVRFVLVGFALLFAGSSAKAAPEVLVADRLTAAIWRYSPDGTSLGLLVRDTTNLAFPSGGMALSPDGTHLYVANRSPSRVVRYDYNGVTATNPVLIVANGASTIGTPGGLLFSADGSTLYVASGSGAGGVARLNPDGTSAGANLTGGSGTARTGLAFDDDGDLLAINASGNGVIRLPAGGSAFADLVAPGVAGGGYLVVHEGNMYIAGAFAPHVSKFNTTTGAIDTTFGVNGYIPNLVFPASIELSPADENSLLVGILGANNNGTGWINRYSLDGADLGHWANATLTSLPLDTNPGFREATGLLVVPEPGTMLLAIGAAAGLSLRKARRGSN